MIEFTKEAKDNPRRIRVNNKWVAIGSEIEIQRGGRAGNTIVPVASQDELEILYKRNAYSHLLKEKKYVKTSKPTESDTGE